MTSTNYHKVVTSVGVAMGHMKGNMALMNGNMALTKSNMALRHVRNSQMKHSYWELFVLPCVTSS